MNTSIQPNNSKIVPHAFFTGFQNNSYPQSVNRYTAHLSGSFVNRNGIFDAVRLVREAEAKQMVAETAQEKAELANKAKSDFLIDMSHEIRTPMGAIIGLATVLMATKLDGRQRECLTAMQSSAEALMGMINGLLDIEKIESRTADLELAPFSMTELLDQIVGIMSVKAQKKGITLNLHYDAELSSAFIGDSGRIRQILLNLVGNAIKFTETGGVSIAFASGRKKNGKKQVSISVTDSGIGISPDKIDIIFEKFIQADPSISRKYGGTGLGLSISKELADIMGGSIRVVSLMDKGSTFVLCLPLSAAPSKPDACSIRRLLTDLSVSRKLSRHTTTLGGAILSATSAS